MKYKILLFAPCLLSFLFIIAQKNVNSAFAIVSTEKGKMTWMNIQEVDLSTGKVIRTIFDKSKTGFVLLNATTRKKIQNEAPVNQGTKLIRYEHPTVSMVAAAAFDKRHNKLFFTPMRFGELR